MDVIHFTHGAADPLNTFDAKGVRFLPLADGAGKGHVACAHLGPGATIDAPSLTHAAALLVVHGLVIIDHLDMLLKIQVHAGSIFDLHQRVPASFDLKVMHLSHGVSNDE
jgi:hypothetical protein